MSDQTSTFTESVMLMPTRLRRAHSRRTTKVTLNRAFARFRVTLVVRSAQNRATRENDERSCADADRYAPSNRAAR